MMGFSLDSRGRALDELGNHVKFIGKDRIFLVTATGETYVAEIERGMGFSIYRVTLRKQATSSLVAVSNVEVAEKVLKMMCDGVISMGVDCKVY